MLRRRFNALLIYCPSNVMFLSFNESKFYQLQQKSKKTFMSHCIHHSHVIIKNKTIRFIPQYNSFVQIRIVYI